MTIEVNIHEAKAQLSHLIERMQQGETVRICKRNQPVAELVPVKKASKKKRIFGTLKGKIKILPGFYDPIYTDEELDEIYNKPLSLD